MPMKLKDSLGRKTFNVLNLIFLVVLAVSCVLPMIHVLSLSLSDKSLADAGLVSLFPMKPTIDSYRYILKTPEFFNGFRVSVTRVVLGLCVNLFLVLITAYPLAKDNKYFKGRTIIVWYFVFTMLFGGGLIPLYMTVQATGIMDTIWALILPGALPVFNLVLMINFFRALPKELEESALIDGAGHWRILFRIYLPLSMAGIATIALFTMVGHWNSWFDGLIFMNKTSNYPLQSYLQTVIVGLTNALTTKIFSEDWKALAKISDRTVKAAQIFIAALPIMLVYPFLQKYFVKGLVLGSVKQ
jgi:putative aldouronate transport system permease protein